MRPMVVQKYGGSSVADVEKIGLVARRVRDRREAGCQLVVVVSAMGDTTDELLALAKTVSHDPPRRELDMLLTCGERISMALLSMALQKLGVPAISFTGSQSGIITDTAHSQARVIEVRPARIEEALASGKVVIVAGYQGVSHTKEVTTLGRGGSDTTAVALAAALGADCEIYSDVDGVYSADPRVVPNAQKLESLAHQEMQELALAGAKVLNAQAVEFAREKGIIIQARSAHGGGTGTRVEPSLDARPQSPVVKGIACDAEVWVLACHGKPDPLLELLEAEQLSARAILSDRTRTMAVISLQDLHGPASLRARLPRSVEVLPHCGTVTCVGAALNSGGKVVRRALSCAAAVEAPLLGWWSSPMQVTLVVEGPSADLLPRLTRQLHREMIEPR